MKHFYKPLLLLLTTAVLLLGGCGVQQTASEQEKNITAENSAVVLAAGRNLAPGEKDGYSPESLFCPDSGETGTRLFQV